MQKAGDEAQTNEDNLQKLVVTAVEYFNRGNFDLAKECAISLTKKFPENYIGYKILGAVYRYDGKLSKSLEMTLKTAKLMPNDAEVYNNLGNLYTDIGQIFEAKNNYEKAIKLNPQNSLFHNNLGHLFYKSKLYKQAIISYEEALLINESSFQTNNSLGNSLFELKRYEEAEKYYQRAIEINPNFSDGYANLGLVKSKNSKNEEAFGSYEKAINLDSENLIAYTGIADLLSKKKLTVSISRLERVLKELLNIENLCDPNKLSKIVITILKSNPVIKMAIKTYKNCTMAQATQITLNLSRTSFLIDFITKATLPDLELERLLIFTRNNILNNLNKFEKNLSVIQFQNALAQHCFINEYIYPITHHEEKLLEKLSFTIESDIEMGQIVNSLQISCLASYRGLKEYKWADCLIPNQEIGNLIKLQISNPKTEEALKSTIPSLMIIKNNISEKVKEQYEKNPYPRWVSFQKPVKPVSVLDTFRQLNIKIRPSNIGEDGNHRLLIAGCGTGRHAIETALRFNTWKVMAIDLSLSSLAYAKRKVNEYGISNVDFYQADILEFKNLEFEFDIIESVGVLHHLETPIDGWSILAGRLKEKGLMKIGLYSSTARADITNYRNSELNIDIGGNHENLVRAREKIISGEESFGYISKIRDFYSASEFRDLLLHEKEHQFTIPKIKSCISKLGLIFCGFESPSIQEKFIRIYGKEYLLDLDTWHIFEEKNPKVFLGMYQFWVQKI